MNWPLWHSPTWELLAGFEKEKAYSNHSHHHRDIKSCSGIWAMVVFIPFDIQRNAHFVCLFKEKKTSFPFRERWDCSPTARGLLTLRYRCVGNGKLIKNEARSVWYQEVAREWTSWFTINIFVTLVVYSLFKDLNLIWHPFIFLEVLPYF